MGNFSRKPHRQLPAGGVLLPHHEDHGLLVQRVLPVWAHALGARLEFSNALTRPEAKFRKALGSKEHKRENEEQDDLWNAL